MDDDGIHFTPIEYSDRSWERAQSYRNAALIGYGALLARNVDGQYTAVLTAMAKSLDIEPPHS
jgi:hypothetical protein